MAKKKEEINSNEFIDNSYLPEEEKEEIINKINRAAREHPVVKVHHGKWKELIAWGDRGEQFSEWGLKGHENELAPVPLRKRIKRVVINMMKPLGEAIEGKINMFSRIIGVPNSSEQRDIEGSKVATKLHEHIDYTNYIDTLNDELKYDMTRTGNAFRTWVFDKDRIVAGKDGDTTGEVIGRVPSVFNIRPLPTSAKYREEWLSLVELMEVPEEEIVKKFKVAKSVIREAMKESKKDSGTPMRQKFVGMNEPVEEKDKDENTYVIAYYWEKTSDKYPEGRLIITLVDTNIVFWAKKNPCLGEIPYFHYGFKRAGNSLWHTGPYHHVQTIQREINRMVSIISEHLEGWRAKMVLPDGANLRKGAFTTDSFEILEVDTTKGDPRPVVMPELSPQITAYRDFLMTAFNLVANVHEVSYSQLPKYASRAPATLFSMMLEQENLKLDPMIARINQTLIKEAKFKLRLADRYYKTERLVKVLGKGKTSQIEYFKGADMRGNFDVKMEIGVSLNQSKTVQQRLLLELKQAGAPIEWNKIYKLLQEGEISEELRGDIQDETKAVRENQAYLNDKYDNKREDGGVFLYIHDDHEVHLEYHTNLIKSEEALRWNDAKFLHLNDHIKHHWVYVQALNQFKMQMTQGQGGPQPPQLPGAGEMPPSEEGVAPEVAETRKIMPA